MDNTKLFRENEIMQYKYINVPKELFINPKYKKLSSDAKLLYGFLLDRFSLSVRNNWRDENGYIFLIFKRKGIQELFNLSDKTVTKAFRELNECKLIYEKKQGRNKPNLIYPCKMDFDSNIWNRKNSDSETGKNTILESENLRCNNTNNNYTNRVNSKAKNKNNFEQRDYSDFNFSSLYANADML